MDNHSFPDGPVSAREAAEALNVTPATIARWIREGAPCIRPGTTGTGNFAIVLVADLAKWKARRLGYVGDSDKRILEIIDAALVNTLIRDADDDDARAAHQVLEIPPDKAAIHLMEARKHLYRAFTGDDPPEGITPGIQKLIDVAAASRA